MTQLAVKEKTMEELKERRSKILNEFLLIREFDTFESLKLM